MSRGVEARFPTPPLPYSLPLKCRVFAKPLSEAVDRLEGARYACQDFSARLRAPVAPVAVLGRLSALPPAAVVHAENNSARAPMLVHFRPAAARYAAPATRPAQAPLERSRRGSRRSPPT